MIYTWGMLVQLACFGAIALAILGVLLAAKHAYLTIRAFIIGEDSHLG